MKFVLCEALVCEDPEHAKKLAFDPYVMMKCVTLDGDVYNPSGLLTGGYSTPSDGQILKKVKEIQRLEEEKRFLTNKLNEVTNELQQLKRRAQEYQDKKN